MLGTFFVWENQRIQHSRLKPPLIPRVSILIPILLLISSLIQSRIWFGDEVFNSTPSLYLVLLATLLGAAALRITQVRRFRVNAVIDSTTQARSEVAATVLVERARPLLRF